MDFRRVENLKAWRDDTDAVTSGEIAAESVTAKEWNFVVGSGAGLFSRLQQMPVKLGSITSHIAQGIRTSANPIYVLDTVESGGETLLAFSERLACNVELERGSVRRFLQGREIKRYEILPSSQVVIMPYVIEDGKARRLLENELSLRYPKTYNYLAENRLELENRENGKMRNDKWYGYVYPKNIEIMQSRKILVPDIADRAAFALDTDATFAFTSGYGITLQNSRNEALEYLLGILNSRVVNYFVRRVSTPLRGGFFRYFTQFLEQIPLPGSNVSVIQHDRMVSLVTAMIDTKGKRAVAATDRDIQFHDRRIADLERQIDELVYTLYGLTDADIALVEGAAVPA